MKKQLALFVVFVMLLSMMPIASFAASTNVAAGNGTLSTAISSASSGDTLVLGDGIYYVPNQITVNKTLTIKAASGANPVIVGGSPATGWELYQGNIYRKAHTGAVTSLVEGNQAGKIATSGTYMVTGLNGNTISSSSIPAGLKTGYAKVITYGATNSNWQTTVSTISANSAGSLTFQGGTARGLSVGSIFDLINDVQFINEPGEFAYDGQYVYYYPYNASKLESDVCFATTGTIFNINGSGNLTLENLDISCTSGGTYNNGNYGGSNAINVAGRATVTGCDFYSIGSNAIMYHGSASALNVSDCTFNGIGGTAVYLYGHNATVTNCAMVNIGFEYSGGAVSIEGNNNTVSHNNISYCTRWGINMCGANSSNGYGNIIEYNDISHCNTKTSDSGLIYLYRMDGTTSSRRNTIRFNAIHDSVCYNSMGFGIYLDDDSDYTDVYGNWVYNLSYNTEDNGYLMGPIMIKGVGSEIHDNVVANNRVTVDYQSGAGNNNAAIVAQQLSGYNTSANKVYRNILYNNGAAGNNRLYRVLDDEPLSNTFAYVDYNVYDKSEGQHSVSAWGAWDMGTWKSNGFDNNALFGVNPGFTNAANGDFTITNTSITSDYYQNPLRKEYIGIISDNIDIPTMAPTEVPVTEAPIDEYSDYLPIAGQNAWNGQDGHAYREGQDLFVWSDGVRSLLGSGEEAMIHFNITTAPVTVSAMRDNESRFKEEIVTFEETGTAILALIPNGTQTDFYAYQNGEFKASGRITLPFANTWNYNVSNSNNINNIYVSSVSRWEAIAGGTTQAPVTEAPVTEQPDPNATLFAEYDLSSVYDNGPNGTNSYSAPVLTMTKDKTGSNYNNIIWSDSADSLTASMTLVFDAKVSGGYGHSWDGYAISLRTNSGGDCELVRLVPTAEGVDITKNAGANIIASIEGTGYHAYSCQYNKGTNKLTVYVDGVKVIDNVDLGWSGTQHGFLLKSGHNDATNVVMDIADVDLWSGNYVRTAPGNYDGATEAPVTEAPVTEAPVTEEPDVCTSPGPATEPPVTDAPVTDAPVTEAPVTEAPVTEAPVTEAPVTEAPGTEAPVTEAPAGELILSKTSVSVKKGESVSVKAYFNDFDHDVTNEADWSSNKTSIATVSNGEIEGVKAGTTKVTVSYGGLTKEISVEVTSGGGGGGGGGSISKPTEAPKDAFDDLASVPWAVEAIEALAKAGIVNGVAERTFDPNGLVTREQFAKMLVETCGFNYAGATCEFYDVVTGAWYYRYVAEAYRQGIMKGINEENMGIGMNITRQDLCTMVYRALLTLKIELPELEEAENFKDDANIASYAKDAVTALQMAGIIDGMGDGNFAPEETATRAQAAKIIYGVYKLITESK